ncbi:MAG: TatD family hydrolase [Saprospiraceae bacterium]|nr:TatD family hydrolase [Saprospiraceae bacterium]
MYIDTHAHLYLSQFDEDRDEVIQRAIDQGIEKILMPNVDLDTVDGMHQLAQRYPNVCFPMMGLHPCSVDNNYEKVLAQIESYFHQQNYIAVGEIGLDLYWDKTFYHQQIEAFRIQASWAHNLDLPIVIHSRESIDEIISLLEKMAIPNLRGVFHCFTGSVEQASRIKDLGFLVGIGGVVTFKNGGLDKVIPYIDPQYIILETDAPYLAPHPNRGKRNESAYIRVIAQKLCEILSLDHHQLEELTTANARKLFALADQPKP